MSPRVVTSFRSACPGSMNCDSWRIGSPLGRIGRIGHPSPAHGRCTRRRGFPFFVRILVARATDVRTETSGRTFEDGDLGRAGRRERLARPAGPAVAEAEAG